MELEISLDCDAALVLFELLASRTKLSDSLSLADYDRTALDLVEASLERVLVEPFAPNYSELLMAARCRLTERYGSQ
jgi:hypothetical protein